MAYILQYGNTSIGLIALRQYKGENRIVVECLLEAMLIDNTNPLDIVVRL